ncbi:MAG TPA: hypothetical protein VMT68_08720 [Caulobacteraceae bacterium]|nr:hypothetical protein [Caulobacteraceae bacterium]
MLAFSNARMSHGRLADRMAWVLERPHRPAPQAPARAPYRLFPPRRQKAASEHLYFEVRPLAGAGGRQLLQYGFVDDRGTVVLSVVGESTLPCTVPSCALDEDLAVAPMDADWLRMLVGSVCRGASLVAFHKVLQGGLLPPGALESADSVECAWRRYVRLARRRGTFDRGEPLTLDDALEATGIGAVGAPDAALRALGVRELWAWMDRVE